MRGSSLRPWTLALLVCAGVVGAGMAYVDRPVADYVHRTLWGTRLVTWATQLLALLPALFITAVLLALGAAGMSFRSKAPGPWAGTLLLSASSAALALVVAVLLKLVIGRADAYPTYLVRGLYDVHWFHGGRGYEAFPSATTAAATAFFAVCWLRVPGSRVVGGVALAFVLTAIVITNGHWVTDVLGGGFLGASMASIVGGRADRRS